MKPKLSDRMKKIAGFVGKGETVGDIGTDHAYVPIHLWQNNISNNIIVSDINLGPLEKARENIIRCLGENPFDIRLSDGLCSYDTGEIDTAVIAGMGGILIRDILKKDISKTRQIKKIIMQPRNAQEVLREWLYLNDFIIEDEVLSKEGKFICEIIVASGKEKKCGYQKYKEDYIDNHGLSFEISPILILHKDPLLLQFIEKKIKKEENIAGFTKNTDAEVYENSMRRIDILHKILSDVKNST